MAKIRHEINLMNGVSTGVSENERPTVDPSQYSGTLTFYYEAVATGTSGGTARLQNLTAGTNTDHTPNSATNTLYSTTFALTVASSFSILAGSGVVIKAARIVIIQDTGTNPLFQCESQIEVGSRSAVTLTGLGGGSSNLTSPKYWKYTASQWNGTVSFFFEANFTTASSKSASSVTLQVADGSGDGFVNWNNVPSGVVTTTSTSVATVRTTTAFAPVDGRWYRVQAASGQSKTAMNLYAARIIIKQYGATDLNVGSTGSGTTFGQSGSSQSTGTTFLASSSYNASGVGFKLSKNASPSDNIVIYLRSGSATGTILAQTASIAASSFTTSAYFYCYPFTTPAALTSGTTYYLTIERTGSLDATNKYTMWQTSDSAYADGGKIDNNSGTWSSPSGTADVFFAVFSSTGITKLQPQYLISNTLLSAGTAVQKFLVNWDSTHWTGVTNTYKLETNAANGSTSDVQLRTANDVTLVATVTDPDNAGSGTATMP